MGSSHRSLKGLPSSLGVSPPPDFNRQPWPVRSERSVDTVGKNNPLKAGTV